MENQINNNVANPQEENKPYWNGKTSDLPLIQQMIKQDNEVFQIHENKFILPIEE